MVATSTIKLYTWIDNSAKWRQHFVEKDAYGFTVFVVTCTDTVYTEKRLLIHNVIQTFNKFQLLSVCRSSYSYCGFIQFAVMSNRTFAILHLLCYSLLMTVVFNTSYDKPQCMCSYCVIPMVCTIISCHEFSRV